MGGMELGEASPHRPSIEVGQNDQELNLLAWHVALTGAKHTTEAV